MADQRWLTEISQRLQKSISVAGHICIRFYHLETISFVILNCFSTCLTLQNWMVRHKNIRVGLNINSAHQLKSNGMYMKNLWFYKQQVGNNLEL